MSAPLHIGIAGYGNLGRGVEAAVARNPDMVLVGIYTRRDPARLAPLHDGAPVFPMDALAGHADDVDVLILCGGSKSFPPRTGPGTGCPVQHGGQL